jgi:branched-chain amino acid transport system ATP-binding protein
MAILEIRNLSKYFGGVAAIDNLDLSVANSEILGIVGPNGAGKSTLFNVICGFFRPSKGKVFFKGEDISKLGTNEIARRGVGRTFQQTSLFMMLTVFENVLTGFHMNYRIGFWRTFLHTTAARKEEEVARQKTQEILDVVGLGSQKKVIAQQLPYGSQKISGVGIALAANPELLLMDEPMAGMNYAGITTMIKLIGELRGRGLTIVLVEHNMHAVRSLCDRIVVLNYGQKLAEGVPEEVLRSKEVIEVYLGGG